MHTRNIDNWKCDLAPEDADRRAERQTRRVIALTLSMMVVEVGAGWIYGSMALLADGWHMGTHAAALGIAAFAYWYADRNRRNPNFTFGTGKVGVLGGYTSAVVLIIVAVIMIGESIDRLMSPVSIHFNEAIAVAVVGLVVNIVSAVMLQGPTGHDHDHSHHHDHNLRAAYLHVLADALTSVFAIVALTAGKFLGWVWMDPVMGGVGALVIINWGRGLLKDTSCILLDRRMDADTVSAIRAAIEADADNRVADIHLWHIGAYRQIAMVSIVTHYPRSPGHYKALLAGFGSLAHISIEVHRCDGPQCIPLARPLTDGGQADDR
ncbi:MAG: CDF family Co(II)/Ni(II) efflux transporter DmeF [Pseudomonadota bacterium]